eukprot:4466289-Amphidinium_carterae.2
MIKSARIPKESAHITESVQNAAKRDYDRQERIKRSPGTLRLVQTKPPAASHRTSQKRQGHWRKAQHDKPRDDIITATVNTKAYLTYF